MLSIKYLLIKVINLKNFLFINFFLNIKKLNLAGFGNRQVVDKTYFISILNNKLKLLQNEINLLTKELDKTDKGRKNLLIYEQR